LNSSPSRKCSGEEKTERDRKKGKKRMTVEKMELGEKFFAEHLGKEAFTGEFK